MAAVTSIDDLQALRTIFMKVQDSTTSHKLSDRNCIEIINKLTTLGLLEVIYTTDGREYLTPQELEREIRDEVTVNGGRINLVDLQQIINVDLSHIENKVGEILKHDNSFTLIQGELINKGYLDRAAEEINEALQDAGQLSVTELSKTFNLPSDFLLNIIEPHMGTTIKGQVDPLDHGILFTESFIARNVAKIRGALSAITRPTPVASLVSQYQLPEKFFSSVLESLVASGRLAGTIQGRLDKAVFIPEVYTQTLNAWISSIFQQNGYIEYDAMQKLGITDSKQFIKRRFKEQGESLIFLQTCCVGKGIQDHIEAVIDEALISGTWIHTRPLLPSPLTEDDVSQLLHHCIKPSQRSLLQIFSDGVVVSNQFVNACKKIFEPVMRDKAENAIRTSPALFAELSKQERANLSESSKAEQKQVKKEERQKKATLGGGQKGGAGRGGRETKTKKVKEKVGKYRGKGGQDNDDEADDECSEKKPMKSSASMILNFMAEDEIENHLNKEFKGLSDKLARDMAEFIHRPLSQDYKEVAKSLFNKRPDTGKPVNRKSHSEFQDKINGLYSNIKLFEKGIKLFDLEVQGHLMKHLLKTVCQDVVNMIFEMVATENLMTLADNESFTNESRLKLLSRLAEPTKTALTNLNRSISLKNLDEFFEHLETIASSEYCDVLLKKVDKKKERQLIFNHRQALADQLDRETEPAMALHLASVILFQHSTSCIIHAPGRCVPQIIAFLKDYVSPEVHAKLSQYQSLVVKQLSGKATGDDVTSAEGGEETNLGAQLSEQLNDIKLLTVKAKKASSTSTTYLETSMVDEEERFETSARTFDDDAAYLIDLFSKLI